MAVKGHVTFITYYCTRNLIKFWESLFYSRFVAIGLNPQNIDHPSTFWGKLKKHPCLNFLEKLSISFWLQRNWANNGVSFPPLLSRKSWSKSCERRSWGLVDLFITLIVTLYGVNSLLTRVSVSSILDSICTFQWDNGFSSNVVLWSTFYYTFSKLSI